MNTTIRAETGDTSSDFWSDHATVIRRDVAGSILHGFARLNSGAFADMVRLVSRMSAADRAELVIEKEGDRAYSGDEVVALSRRADFPA